LKEECDPPKHQVQIHKTGIQKSRGYLMENRTTPQTDYSVLEAHKLGPRMELSRRDELHSYDDGDNSKGI
jgi:hypothetical protein